MFADCGAQKKIEEKMKRQKKRKAMKEQQKKNENKQTKKERKSKMPSKKRVETDQIWRREMTLMATVSYLDSKGLCQKVMINVHSSTLNDDTAASVAE